MITKGAGAVAHDHEGEQEDGGRRGRGVYLCLVGRVEAWSGT